MCGGRYCRRMNQQQLLAIHELAQLGFRGPTLQFVEMVPAIEMAWADGSIHPDEMAVLEAYGEEILAGAVSGQAHQRELKEALAAFLRQRTTERLDPVVRKSVTRLLSQLFEATPGGGFFKERIIEWATAVAVVAGRPVWDPAELRWLKTVEKTLTSRRTRVAH